MNTMRVAGHRGVREGAPENTMKAFKMAVALGVDMIETDIRQTKDGELVLMHDALLERTTNGHGTIREYTLSELRALDAGEGERIPTLREFLLFVQDQPGLEVNLELKDYPHVEGEAWAFSTADKSVALVEELGLGARAIFNSFSARVLEYISERYARAYRLHGFYPYDIMMGAEGNPSDYLYCACIFSKSADGIYSAESYRALEDVGVEPWVGASVKSREALADALSHGARLVTSDNPGKSLAILRELGAHA